MVDGGMEGGIWIIEWDAHGERHNMFDRYNLAFDDRDLNEILQSDPSLNSATQFVGGPRDPVEM